MLPCAIRARGNDRNRVCGFTEKLARERLIVAVELSSNRKWLTRETHIVVLVDLPSHGGFRPKQLKCEATISSVREFRSGTYIDAMVQRMTVIDRGPITAISRSQKLQPVIQQDHLNNLNQGDNTMSFLKNFFIEEDGQDMVEYGLVIALLVAAAAGVLGTYFSSVTLGFNAMGTNIKTNVIK